MEGAERRGLRPWPRAIDLSWLAIAILLPVLVILLSRLHSIDLAYHVRAGDEMRATSSLLRSDTWTFSEPGSRWVDQQWGAQVLISLLFGIGGWATMLVTWAATTAMTATFIYLACRGRGAAVRTSAILTLAGFVVALPSLAMRPQALAMPAFAAALWAIATRHERPWRLWLLPVLAAVVANLHGSFVLFPLAAAVAWLEDRSSGSSTSRSTLIVLISTILATLLNPFGLGAWTYALSLATNDVVRTSVVEWEPTTLVTTSGLLFFGSFGVVVVLIARRREPIPWTDLLWLGAFLLLGLLAQRSSAWWGLVFPVVLAGWWRVPTSSRATGSRIPAVAIVVTLALAALALLPWWRGADRDLLIDVPFGLSEHVEMLPDGTKTFVYQPWASWFELEAPQLPVFVDSRIEIFGATTWDDYAAVAFAGAGWRETLDEYDVEAIVAISNWDILPYLRDDPGWVISYEDDEGLLFVRA